VLKVEKEEELKFQPKMTPWDDRVSSATSVNFIPLGDLV
jgi:hypothetical protein